MKKNKLSKLQISRKLVQIAFLIALLAGVYSNIRMVIMILLPATLLFGNFFCGWVCPFGTIQEITGDIGNMIFKKKLKMPTAVQKYIQYSRYILFGILILGVIDFILMPLNAYGTFLAYFMGTGQRALTITALIIMILYLIIALLFERPFCNYFCTEAAKYGVLSLARIFSIKRNENSCINCKLCDKACPMNISVSEHDHIRNGQCINCMKCIEKCPVPNTLKYKKVKYNFIKKNGK